MAFKFIDGSRWTSLLVLCSGSTNSDHNTWIQRGFTFPTQRGKGDPSDQRRVVVEEFKVVFEDERPPIVYRLDTPAGMNHMRASPFDMPEGARYKFEIKFRVNHKIVSGLRFRNKVKKTVLSTSDEIVLGSYAPRSLTYEFVYPRRDWMEAPAGMFYRGKYMAQFRFTDDDNEEHLKAFYTFEIKKT